MVLRFYCFLTFNFGVVISYTDGISVKGMIFLDLIVSLNFRSFEPNELLDYYCNYVFDNDNLVELF